MPDEVQRSPYAVGPKQQFRKIRATRVDYTEGYAVIRRATPASQRVMVGKYTTREAALRVVRLLNELHDVEA
jgi:hypothetical protein